MSGDIPYHNGFTFDIECKLVGTGLLGQGKEDNPWLSWHASWGEYRLTKEMGLKVVSSTVHNDGLAENLDMYDKSYGKGGLGSHVKTMGDAVIANGTTQNIKRRDRTVFTYQSDSITNLKLPSIKTARGDECITFKLWADTSDSGVPLIDKTEKGLIYKDLQTGCADLYLSEVMSILEKEKNNASSFFSSEGTTVVINKTFIEPKLVSYFVQEGAAKLKEERGENSSITSDEKNLLIGDAIYKCTKATAEFHIHITPNNNNNGANGQSFSHNVQSTATTSTKNEEDVMFYSSGFSEQVVVSSQTHLLYGRSQGEMDNTMNTILSHYVKNFMNTPKSKALHGPADESLRNLQMAIYKSEKGVLPLVPYFITDHYDREYTNEEERHMDNKIYAFNERTETFLLMMARDSLRRHGMSEEFFIDETEKQFKHTGSNVSNHFLTCVQVVADIGTFAANTVNYTADFRYGKCLKCMLFGKGIGIESFDSGQLNGTSNCGDCEDMAKVAAGILQALSRGLYELENGKWESKLLNTIKMHTDSRYVFCVGATVTSAYIDAHGKPIAGKDMKDLPIIGDPVDINSESGGHCYGLWVPKAIAMEWLKNGGADINKLPDMENGTKVFHPWEYNLKVPVLEGTGSIDEFVLPTMEVYGENSMKTIKIARTREFVRYVRKNCPTLSAMTSFDGMPFYFKNNKENQRISPFYKKVAHGASPCIYKQDNSLAQFAFCDKRTGLVGVDIENILRDGMHNESGEREFNISLVSPYKDIGDYWKTDVVPLIETIQNQLPYMAFGRYTNEQYNKTFSDTIALSFLLDGDDEDEFGIKIPGLKKVKTAAQKAIAKRKLKKSEVAHAKKSAAADVKKTQREAHIERQKEKIQKKREEQEERKRSKKMSAFYDSDDNDDEEDTISETIDIDNLLNDDLESSVELKMSNLPISISLSADNNKTMLSFHEELDDLENNKGYGGNIEANGKIAIASFYGKTLKIEKHLDKIMSELSLIASSSEENSYIGCSLHNVRHLPQCGQTTEFMFYLNV